LFHALLEHSQLLATVGLTCVVLVDFKDCPGFFELIHSFLEHFLLVILGVNEEHVLGEK